jgi:hypothetical protein
VAYVLLETSKQIEVDTVQNVYQSLEGEAYGHDLINGEGLEMMERQEAKRRHISKVTFHQTFYKVSRLSLFQQ